jgi:DNA end-binding protein Ku
MASTTISFGMVSIPVRLHASSRDKKVAFHQVHRACGSRLNSQSVCRTCNQVVDDKSEVVKGYDVAKDQMVLLEEHDFEGLPIQSLKVFDVVATVPAAELPDPQFAKTYWVGPDDRTKTSHKGFLLLRDALVQSGRAAVGRVAVTTGKESLAVIRPWGKAMVLTVLYWPDEMIEAATVVSVNDVELTERERELAAQLVQALAKPVDCLQDQVDRYREALEAVIAAKLEGREPAALPVAAKASTDDLMAALEASLGKAA